jgi:hypothetical protein
LYVMALRDLENTLCRGKVISAGALFNQVPAQPFPNRTDAQVLQPCIVLVCKFRMSGGLRQVQPPAAAKPVCGAFKTCLPKTLKLNRRVAHCGIRSFTFMVLSAANGASALSGCTARAERPPQKRNGPRRLESSRANIVEDVTRRESARPPGTADRPCQCKYPRKFHNQAKSGSPLDS